MGRHERGPEGAEVLGSVKAKRKGSVRRVTEGRAGNRKDIESTHLLRQPLHQLVHADLVNERLRDGLLEHGPSRLNLLVKAAFLELDLESVERARELVREDGPRDGSFLRMRQNRVKAKGGREGVSSRRIEARG